MLGSGAPIHLLAPVSVHKACDFTVLAVISRLWNSAEVAMDPSVSFEQVAVKSEHVQSFPLSRR